MEERKKEMGGTPFQTTYPVNLPNSNTILVLGIVSLAVCWWHILSIIGIAVSITTLVLAKKELFLYFQDPSKFTVASLNNVKAGRVCAMISLIISIIVFVVAILMMIGLLALLPIWGMVS